MKADEKKRRERREDEEEGEEANFSKQGHNGAGKTSTLNMLMGSFLPTSGDAMLFGRSVSSDIDLVRHRLGVCSQFGNFDCTFSNYSGKKISWDSLLTCF